MLNWFKRRAEVARKAGELYGGVVAAARRPAFYRELGVPDTPEGRFELIALHLFLAIEALRACPGGSEELARRTIEAFVADMDDCMREMGVGDLGVPKKVKKAAAAFYGRSVAYRAALGGDDSDLTRALLHWVYEDKALHASQAEELAAHVRRAWARQGELAPSDRLADFGTCEFSLAAGAR